MRHKLRNEYKKNLKYKTYWDTPLNLGFDRVPIQKNIDVQMVLQTHQIAMSHFTSTGQAKSKKINKTKRKSNQQKQNIKIKKMFWV